MKKVNVVKLLVFVCLLMNSVVIAQVIDYNTQKPFGFKIGLRGGVGMGTIFGPVTSVENFPKYMRDVPVHKGDKYKVKSNSPIVNDKIKFPFQIGGSANYCLFFEFRLYQLRLRLGLGKWFFNNLSWTPESSTIRRRDYLKNPGSNKRGYGTALTFYGIHYYDRDTYEVPAHTVELELLWKKNKEWSWNYLIGYIDLPHELRVVKGWDRWNSLEYNQTFVLEKYHLGVVYSGLVWRVDNRDFGFYLLAGSVLTWGKDRLINDDILIKYKKVPIFLEMIIRLEL